MESLVDQLEAAGKLDDTVIVLSADHYPYGLDDESYSELLGHTVDPVFEIYESTLILWSADLEEPVYVDKYCSSLDVMPTLANLFGLEYDSRLIMGRDILSDEPGLVIFSNYSFLTDLGRYDSTTDVFEMWDGSEPDPEYVAQRLAEVQNRVAYSAAILDNDTTVWYLKTLRRHKKVPAVSSGHFFICCISPDAVRPKRRDRPWRASAPAPPRRW